MVTVATATPIPPSVARRSISNAPRSRMPLIVTDGAVVSRTVSVAERKFTLAAGASQRGEVEQLRLNSTYSPVAGTSRFASRRFPASSRSSSCVGRAREIARPGGGAVEANAAERDTRRHVEAQADVLADRRVGPQERQVERTVRGPAPAVERRERGLDRVRHRVRERQPGPVRPMARPQPNLARAGSRRGSRRRRDRGSRVGVGVGVSVGVGVGSGWAFRSESESRWASRSGSAPASAWRFVGRRRWSAWVGRGRLRRRRGVGVSVGVGSGVGVGVATGLSTVSVCVCCAVLPAASVTTTRSVCGPSGTVVVSTARPTWPTPGHSAPTARSTVLSAGDSSAQPPKDAPATGVPSSNASLATARGRCRSRGPRGRACRSPVRARRRPRALGSVASLHRQRRRAQFEAGETGVRAALGRLAAQPQRDPLAAGRKVATPSPSALSSDASRRQRAVARPAPHPVQPHAGERRRGRHVDPRRRFRSRRRIRPRESAPRTAGLDHRIPVDGGGHRPERGAVRPAAGPQRDLSGARGSRRAQHGQHDDRPDQPAHSRRT